MPDLPEILQTYPAFLKYHGHGDDDLERFNFVLGIAPKMLQHSVIMVTLDIELKPHQMAAMNMPKYPAIVTPVDEKMLEFFSNKREVQRLIDEIDPVKERLLFTSGNFGTVVDCVSVLDLLYIVSMPRDYAPPILDRMDPIKPGDRITINQRNSARSKGFG